MAQGGQLPGTSVPLPADQQRSGFIAQAHQRSGTEISAASGNDRKFSPFISVFRWPSVVNFHPY